MPMNIYFPLVFRVEHSCLAAIPIYSTVGQDGLVSVTGYGELIVATQSKIKEITFIYTAPLNDCTLQLQSMILADVQCANLLPTESSTISSSETSTSDSSITSLSSISRTSTYTIYTTIPNDDRYTSIRATPGDDSFNNPIFHLAIPICPVRHPKFRIVMQPVPYKQAVLVCLRKGLRLAKLDRSDLGDAISLASACLGANQSIWIGGYWKKTPGINQCLELMTGKRSSSGGINLASSCEKEQPVLCEDPYFTP